MSISISRTVVDIVSPWITCDACSRQILPFEELASLSLERIKPPERFWSSAGSTGTYKAQGIPFDEQGAQNMAESRGWKIMKVYGKDFVVCPDCQQKEVNQSVARTEPSPA
jgi:hypothetical protein